MPANYVLIGEFTLGATATSVTFSNIPQTGYTDLKVIVSGRFSSGSGFNLIDFNGLSTANFSNRVLEGNGASATSFVSGNTNYAGALNGSGDTANSFSNEEIYIPNYAGNTFKSISFDAVMETNGTTAYQDLGALLWSNTAAITSIKLTTHTGAAYAVGSTFSLYGIAAFGTTPTVLPKATGGDIVVNDGTYWYHAFLSSGIFTPSSNLSCDYLVVAGGGSGGVGSAGGGGAGGGGAGGFRTSMGTTGGGGSAESPLSIAAGSYTVTVGAGGAAVSLADYINGNQGNSSTFSTVTSTGGGYGAGAYNAVLINGGPGGSGGGGAEWNRTSGTAFGGTPATPTQGFRGGNCSPTSPDRHGGGGGGASQAGGDTVNAANGKGGDGYSVTYVSSAMPTIPSAMGGGGGGSSEGNAAAGGTGGGGAGLNPTPSPGTATSGTANTGGGGGGAGGNSGTLKTSGAGGSGIVIVRYTMA